MQAPVEGLEKKLGYRFVNTDLLVRALTHRSCAAEGLAQGGGDNEQLEFLGDSILGFVVSEALVKLRPQAQEGQLSQWKSHLVSATHLHQCAVTIGLGEFLLLGRGEERNGGRGRKTLLANAFEAVIAAIHLDGGIDAACQFVGQHVLPALAEADGDLFETLNHKSVLQERTQALGMPVPRYATVGTSGPEHAKVFTVEARVGDHLIGRATGSSKKAASQQAAERLIQQLNAVEQGQA
ncbi:MAG TPA: ribonuclease III [Bryobacteraceae bacterium]|nr:ribonuclease III [Bryobacteraceae bacterium]